MPQSTGIVTDSMAGLPDDLARESSVQVLPIRAVEIDAVLHLEPPSASDFDIVLEELRARGHEEGVILTSSSRLAPVYEKAVAAANGAAIAVEVVDSHLAGPGQGLMARRLAQRASFGGSAEVIGREAPAVRSRIGTALLARDTRGLVDIGALRGRVGGRFGRGAIIELDDWGAFTHSANARGNENAIRQLANRALETAAGESSTIIVAHAGDEALAEELGARLRADARDADVVVVPTTGPLALVGGAGSVWLAWESGS